MFSLQLQLIKSNQFHCIASVYTSPSVKGSKCSKLTFIVIQNQNTILEAQLTRKIDNPALPFNPLITCWLPANLSAAKTSKPLCQSAKFLPKKRSTSRTFGKFVRNKNEQTTATISQIFFPKKELPPEIDFRKANQSTTGVACNNAVLRSAPRKIQRIFEHNNILSLFHRLLHVFSFFLSNLVENEICLTLAFANDSSSTIYVHFAIETKTDIEPSIMDFITKAVFFVHSATKITTLPVATSTTIHQKDVRWAFFLSKSLSFNSLGLVAAYDRGILPKQRCVTGNR